VRYVKVLMLAAVAATAIMAFGASSASATALCTVNAGTHCPAESMEPSGTDIHTVLAPGTSATLTSSLVDVHCTTSTVTGETENTGGTEELLLGEITALSFSGCKTTGGTNCTVTVVGVSSTITPTATVEATDHEGNGIMEIDPEEGKTAPGAKVVCGLFINCTFESPEGFLLDMEGGAPAHVTASEEELDRSGGICPATASWDATYEVTSPTPAYLTTG
jgi:hypothetical protein